jgi:hypothetical protein
MPIKGDMQRLKFNNSFRVVSADYLGEPGKDATSETNPIIPVVADAAIAPLVVPFISDIKPIMDEVVQIKRGPQRAVLPSPC